jgi:outer membrane immunogenic protein
MTRMIILAAAAAMAAATPAAAQEAPAAEAAPTNSFTGGHVGLNIGFADEDVFGTELFTYGVEVGYDYDFGGAVVGAVAEIQDSDDTGRELSLSGRVGAKPARNVLVYGLAGYANLEIVDDLEIDGLRLGGGVEVAPAPHVSVKLEQRYTNYEFDVDAWQTVLGVGFRF